MLQPAEKEFYWYRISESIYVQYNHRSQSNKHKSVER
jgi:hypothetical protein